MATRRGYYREELRRSIHNLNMALTHLERFVEAYSEQHPEIAVVAIELGNMIVQTGELIQKLHDEI